MRESNFGGLFGWTITCDNCGITDEGGTRKIYRIGGKIVRNVGPLMTHKGSQWSGDYCGKCYKDAKKEYDEFIKENPLQDNQKLMR